MPAEGRLPATTRLTAVARAALIAVGALPWILPLARAALPIGAAGAAIDRAFGPLCHRLPERTLAIAGVPMPLCSRCAGIFAGAAIAAIAAWPRLSLDRLRWIIGVTGALMVLDVVTQDLGVHPIWHTTRVISGALFGAAIALAVITAVRGEAATCARPSDGTR